MTKRILNLLLVLFVIVGHLHAEDVTTVEAKDSEISDNLDLNAVASLFGEAKNLEDFEKKLNDPKTQISNLDLNEDGEVDYLRVTENSKDKTHLVTIQATIAKDKYQDVATITVEKDSAGQTQAQVVGDVYMYGPDYVIQPVYVHPPVIYVWFWGPYYSPWRSPYYFGFYPPFYRPWRPYPPRRYHRNVNVHVNVNNSYNRTTVKRSKTSVDLQNKSRRNDYGKKHPDKSFSKRNKGGKNKNKPHQKKNHNKQSTGRPVQNNWTPPSQGKGGNKVKNNKVSVPSKKSGNKPSSKPSTKPTKKQKKKPAKKPTKKSKKQPKSQPKKKPQKSHNKGRHKR